MPSKLDINSFFQDSVFFEDFFEKKELLSKDCQWIKDIQFDLSSFEELVWYTSKIDPSKLRILSNSTSDDLNQISGNDILAKILDSIRLKKSIVVNFAENFNPSLARLVRNIGDCFNCTAYSSVFFTPKGGKCFREHFDAIDVLVLQLSGSKKWKLGDPIIELADKNQSIKLNESYTNKEVILSAGDFLYLPRGTVHNVSALLEGYSLHISVGLHSNRNVDIYKEMISNFSLFNLELRKTPYYSTNKILPPNGFNFASNMEKAFNLAEAKKSVERLNCSKLSQLELLPCDRIENLINNKRVDENSIFEKYEGMPSQHTIHDGYAYFVFPMNLNALESWTHKSIRVPLSVLPTLKFINQINLPFKVKDLPPKNLDLKSKMIIINKLIELNYLYVK